MPDLSPVDIERLYERSPEEAVAYLKKLGVSVTWDWQEQLRTVQAQAFTIPKVASADILEDVRQELVRASESGVAWKAWQDQVGEMLERKGWKTKSDGSAWRLGTIFRTNMQSAYQSGRYERMQAATAFEFWQYRAVGDARTRPKHAELDGIILPKSDPFWSRSFVPNGYACRCSVTALTRSQALRKGYRPPKDRKAVNESGRVVNVDRWEPDAGFAGVPGHELTPDLEKYDRQIRRQLQLDLDREKSDRDRSGRTFSTTDIKSARQLVDDSPEVEQPYGEIVDDVVAGRRKRSHPDKLSAEQEASLVYYTGRGYRSLNRALRRGKATPQQESFSRILDSAINRTSQKFRTLYRGIPLKPKELQRFLSKHEVGAVVGPELGFTSTTTRRRVATRNFRGSVIIELKVGSGASLRAVSLKPKQAEVLIGRGLRYRVDDVRFVKTGRQEHYHVTGTVVE